MEKGMTLMKQPIIYIRAYKRTTVYKKSFVHLGDIAETSCCGSVKNQLDSLTIFNIPKPAQKGRIDVIKAILSVYPEAMIQSVGEMDILIEYLPKQSKESPVKEWIKAALISVIVFAGATIAIMAYSTDTSLPKTFSILNKIFTGTEVENPVFITIPYSIGIAIGIVVFFNHIGTKKITDDPSPMQIEINKYEEDVENSMVDSMTDKKRGEP
ncbi:MAG: stage sporulation protein [Clostridia bacterium]|nr:stage sporulation protein [Clostridia bacterium]